jgi:hypothetical protein
MTMRKRPARGSTTAGAGKLFMKTSTRGAHGPGIVVGHVDSGGSAAGSTFINGGGSGAVTQGKS